ncbi:helix-turn-helix DNA binding domain protein [Microbacterium phage SBlackberry]|nr:helix-turn-helix DNA binding protein [Microbacterium phage Cicada]UAW08776.1 helix-turn-helix DNA binding domain protein [Microbacterium phage SBlackberry]
MTRGKIPGMTDSPTPPTNRAVADKLGLSESGVSRLRSGDRLPSLALMQKIEAAYGWSVQGQSIARTHNDWRGAFEKVLVAADRFDDA